MAPKPVVLVLGSGPRIGAALIASFTKAGYQIATASRKGTGSKTAEGILSLTADFSAPSSVAAVFAAVTKEYHSAPSVVIYNAGSLTPPPDQASVLSIPLEAVLSDLNVNTVSAYAAAQQAVLAWATLGDDVKKTFIYTGNATNRVIVPWPMMINAAMGKAATAAWVGTADALYGGKYRFFYADERHADGKLKGMEVDGEAHGEFYVQLAAHPEGLPWEATFVKGQGHVAFK